jgi:hypothetical protein
MYPSGLAERVRNGAEVTAETVSNVTVAVALIDGLDVLTINRSAADVRNILNALFAALNSAAITQGVFTFFCITVGFLLSRGSGALFSPSGFSGCCQRPSFHRVTADLSAV